jgi:putative transposase
MPKGRLGAEQNVTKLRQIEVLQGQGKSVSLGCKEAETTEQTYYRWHREYGGLNVAQPKRLKQLEDENGRLMKLVADLSLEKQVLIARPRRSQSRCPSSTEPKLCNSLSLRLVQKIG